MIEKILVSQPRPTNESSPYYHFEKQYGVKCDFHQLIAIEGLSAREFRQQHIYPQDYTAVIFNSRLGVDHYFRLCAELRFQVPESMHYYCISEQVGYYLQKYIQYRKRKVFFPESGKADFAELIPTMHRRPNETYLMVLSDIHTQDQIRMFAENDIQVQPAVMYRTVPIEWNPSDPFDYDMVVLFTPSGVKSIQHNFPEWKQGDTVLAAIGDGTIAALEEAGYRVDIKAGKGLPFASLTMAIEDYLERQQ